MGDEGQMISQIISSSNLPMVLVCTVCNKTDPLNGQFCVFCGGKTIAGTAPRPVGNFATGPMPMQANLSADYNRLSMEVPRTVPTSSNSAKAGSVGIMATLFGLILGALAGAGLIYYMKDSVQQSTLHNLWPPEGLLVYTNHPNASVRLEDIKHKTFVFGSTSNLGTFVCNSLPAGGYKFELSDASGKNLVHSFRMNTGEPVVIGYPERLKFK